MSVFCTVDDKYVPLFRILWISVLPHFCGSADCTREGRYEIRLEQGESVWATCDERDKAVSAVEVWQTGEEETENDKF